MTTKPIFFLLSLLAALGPVMSAKADIALYQNDQFTFNMGGYARVYSGKLESLQYNTVFKTEPRLTAEYKITDDLSLKGKVAYRIVRDDRFADKKLSKVRDAYGSIASKQYGTLDIGKLRNVAYLLHQGSVDVSCMDIDDSDISYFFKTPSGFYAPYLTYLDTDSRDPKINYTTPDLNGWTFGLTAVRSENIKPDTVMPGGNQLDHGKGAIGGARYKYVFAPAFWTAFSGGIAFYKDNTFIRQKQPIEANHREYSLGMKIGIHDFTLASSYKRLLFADKVMLKDSSAFQSGIAYNKGKYGVSLSWLHSQAEFVEKNKYNHVMFSNKYAFTDNLEAFVSVGQVEFFRNKTGKEKHLFGIFGMQFKL